MTTAQPTFWLSSSAAPEAEWRITRMSGFIAFSVTAVSIRVSPFFTDEEATGMVTTSAPSRLAAISNEELVRVEFSKNRFTTVRPCSRSRALDDWRLKSTKASPRSSSCGVTKGFRSEAARKWALGNGISRSRMVWSVTSWGWVIETRL